MKFLLLTLLLLPALAPAQDSPVIEEIGRIRAAKVLQISGDEMLAQMTIPAYEFAGYGTTWLVNYDISDPLQPQLRWRALSTPWAGWDFIHEYPGVISSAVLSDTLLFGLSLRYAQSDIVSGTFTAVVASLDPESGRELWASGFSFGSDTAWGHFNGPKPSRMQVHNGYLYVGMGYLGLVIFEIVSADSLIEVARTDMGCADFAAVGDRLWFWGFTPLMEEWGENGIDLSSRLLDISDPSQPEELGEFDPRYIRAGHWRLDDLIYKPQPGGFFHIFDITSDTPFEPVDSLALRSTSTWMARDGNRLFQRTSDRIYVYDITDPTSPQLIAQGSYRNPEFYLMDGIAAGRDNIFIYSSWDHIFYGLESVVFYFGPNAVPEEADPAPSNFALHEPYPNPFNGVVTIRYDLPEASPVRIAVYNLSGREVARLAQGRQPAGRHSVVWEEADVASGVYVVHLDTPGHSLRTKTILLK